MNVKIIERDTQRCNDLAEKLARVTVINGDGNSNPATVINTDVSGTLDYDDLVKLWASFSPFEMNTMVCHIDSLKTILALDEFKDPLAGYRFQSSGELFSPLTLTVQPGFQLFDALGHALSLFA